jgi:hypothetical protein
MVDICPDELLREQTCGRIEQLFRVDYRLRRGKLCNVSFKVVGANT